MPYSHKGKRNRLVWDGPDNEIHSDNHTTTCPHCRSEEHYNAEEMTHINKLPSPLLEYIRLEGIVIKNLHGCGISKDTAAQAIKHYCTNCEKLFVLIVGIKEVQPQRFTFFHRSTVYESS